MRLSREELTKIEELELEKESPIRHARNIFCIQVYTAGSRISDIIMLRWSNIKGDRLDFRQIKSDWDHDIKIPDTAVKIFRNTSTGERRGVVSFFLTWRTKILILVFPLCTPESELQPGSTSSSMK